MLTTRSTGYLRLSPLEVAMGLPTTASAEALPQPEIPPPTSGARAVLREVLAQTLEAGPVFVAFSGGRDSSAVLAVAVSVARERGTALPVPVTYRYPGDGDADENEWQDMVLRHLGVTEHVVIDITDQQRILGPSARESMATRGLVWPASVNIDHEMLSRVRGGVLLTGEGGDELFSGRRSAPLARLRRTVRRRHRPRPGDVRAAVRTLLPQGAALRTEAERVQGTMAPWLRGHAREEFVATVRDHQSEPVLWDRSIRVAAARPLARAVYHNLDLVARDYDVRLVHPLLEPAFVSAWIGDGGRLGVTGRTAAMRQLFDDVLPEQVLGRSSKAFFNASRFGAGERDFARHWDGRGLELEHVDPDTLRETWLHAELIGRSDIPLMAAWMASEGLPLEGPRP